MSLTVVKYRKTPAGNIAISPSFVYRPNSTTATQLIKKRIVKIEESGANATTTTTTTAPAGIVINEISATIKPTMKRASTTSTITAIPKIPKYLLQSTIGSTASNSTIQWLGDTRKNQLGTAISLPPNTIIKATTRPSATIINNNNLAVGNAISSTSTPTLSSSPSVTPTVGSVASPVRQAVFIKREMPQRTMRSMTLGLIDQNPLLHLGVLRERLPLLKRTICRSANVSHLDCCITLKKLCQNESFALLAEYFELTEAKVEEVFKTTIIKLARYLRYLIRWPDSKHYYERLKYVPMAYRRNLLNVRSLIACVETDLDSKLNLGFSGYKFILCINTNGIISYVSDAYRCDCDDLQLFEASNFNAFVPKYLNLLSEPGLGVQRKRSSKSSRSIANIISSGDTDSLTDSADEDDVKESEDESLQLPKSDAQRFAGELASMQSLTVTDGVLTSTRAPSINIPTLNVREPACRSQMREMIDALREFRMLGNSAIQQTSLLGYLPEMLIVAAALINLQR